MWNRIPLFLNTDPPYWLASVEQTEMEVVLWDFWGHVRKGNGASAWLSFSWNAPLWHPATMLWGSAGHMKGPGPQLSLHPQPALSLNPGCGSLLRRPVLEPPQLILGGAERPDAPSISCLNGRFRSQMLLLSAAVFAVAHCTQVGHWNLHTH